MYKELTTLTNEWNRWLSKRQPIRWELWKVDQKILPFGSTVTKMKNCTGTIDQQKKKKKPQTKGKQENRATEIVLLEEQTEK